MKQIQDEILTTLSLTTWKSGFELGNEINTTHIQRNELGPVSTVIAWFDRKRAEKWFRLWSTPSGSLYPALYTLEHDERLIESRWRTESVAALAARNNLKQKEYRLTQEGMRVRRLLKPKTDQGFHGKEQTT